MQILKLACIVLAAIYTTACNNKMAEKPATSTENTNVNNSHVNKATSKIEVINIHDFDKAVTGKKVQLVDVRSNMEYKKGHLQDAQLCDFMADDFTTQLEALNLKKDEPVYIYCHSGGRSGEAAQIMKGLGYQHIIDMENGYSNWSKNNLPTTLE